MRNPARNIAVYYTALMFMGMRYQIRVKNSFNTPATAAVGFVSLLVGVLVLYVLKVANDHGYFLWLMNLRGRMLVYPVFILIYFMNWMIWRKISQPESTLGKDSRELAERLPVGTILFIVVVCLAAYIFSGFLS